MIQYWETGSAISAVVAVSSRFLANEEELEIERKKSEREKSTKKEWSESNFVFYKGRLVIFENGEKQL